MMVIFEDHATLDGKRITLHEAACILARAMGRMYERYASPQGYDYEDLAFSLESNVIDAYVDGDPEDPS